ncbi:MAG: thioredoxin family protein [Bacteroidota bacterium]
MSKYRVTLFILIAATMLCSCFTITFQQTEPKTENERSVQTFLRNEQIDTTSSFIVDSSTYRKALKSGFSLPKFKVYDASGKQIFYKVGYTSSFIEKLEEALTQAETVFEANTLEDELKNIRRYDGSPVTMSDVTKNVQYTFVEYWAIWCGPCKDQLLAIDTYMKEHPAVTIHHIKVNWDKQEAWELKEHAE